MTPCATPEGRLDRKVVTSWRLGELVTTVLLGGFALLIVYAVAVQTAGNAGPALLITLACVVIYGVVFVGIVPAIRYARFRFSVNADEVDIMRGIIVHKRTIIPLVRVQHVDTRQGPIMRAFKLSSVTIATAAGMHEIPGLPLEQADSLRDKVAEFARIAKEGM